MKKIFLLLAVILVGCNVQKREVAKMQVYAVRYPGPFKILANTLDPCFSGIAKADTVIFKDTVIVSGSVTRDTIRRKDTLFITNTIKLPGQKISTVINIHDTVTNDRAVGAVSSRLKIASDSLLVVKTNLTSKNKAKNIWMEIAIGCMVLILGTVAVKAYLLFNGGAAVGIIKKIV